MNQGKEGTEMESTSRSAAERAACSARARRTHKTVIPAHEGYILLEPFFIDCHSPMRLVHSPILAWLLIEADPDDDLDAQHSLEPAVPVTLDGTGELTKYAVKRPDGRVTIPGDCFFEHEEGLLAYWRKIELYKAAPRSGTSQ